MTTNASHTSNDLKATDLTDDLKATGTPKDEGPVLVPDSFIRKEFKPKNHYFDNEVVEGLMYKYLESACTDVSLRDQIMEQAEELIRQIIKAHNLSQIYPGRDESSIGDLFQTAWIQIESALYKYSARPHCSSCYNQLRPTDSILSEDFIFSEDLLKKIHRCPHCKIKLTREGLYYKGTSRVFNLWSQVARTVILAYIKKENRDRKNGPVFQSHLEHKEPIKSFVLERFITEAKDICKYNKEHMCLIGHIEQLYLKDEKPSEGLISKLVERSGMSRAAVTDFLRIIRLRSHDFTDSPVNEENETRGKNKGEDNDGYSEIDG